MTVLDRRKRKADTNVVVTEVRLYNGVMSLSLISAVSEGEMHTVILSKQRPLRSHVVVAVPGVASSLCSDFQ